MIGIFDSGIGGLTVARAIEESLPAYPILYLGDIARAPYGPKSARTIIDYSIENSRFLIKNGAKIIVIGCNSASSVATEALRKEFDVPIIEVITPAVNEALRKTKNFRIGVIGTGATIRSEAYDSQIVSKNSSCRVFTKACPLLVPLVEEGWVNKRETKMILRRYLHPLKDCQLDTLILGCTHYPLLKSLIQARIGRKVKLIDSSQAVASYLKSFLQQKPEIPPVASHCASKNRYYMTDITETTESLCSTIFGRAIELNQA